MTLEAGKWSFVVEWCEIDTIRKTVMVSQPIMSQMSSNQTALLQGRVPNNEVCSQEPKSCNNSDNQYDCGGECTMLIMVLTTILQQYHAFIVMVSLCGSIGSMGPVAQPAVSHLIPPKQNVTFSLQHIWRTNILYTSHNPFVTALHKNALSKCPNQVRCHCLLCPNQVKTSPPPTAPNWTSYYSHSKEVFETYPEFLAGFHGKITRQAGEGCERISNIAAKMKTQIMLTMVHSSEFAVER